MLMLCILLKTKQKIFVYAQNENFHYTEKMHSFYPIQYIFIYFMYNCT